MRVDALAGGTAGAGALEPLLRTVLDALTAGAARRGGPVPSGTPDDLARDVARVLTQRNVQVTSPDQPGAAFPLHELTAMLAQGSADPADPACAAHLHCPPLAVAVAADLAVSALNPSLDSWDQAPAATTVERLLLEELAALVGYAADESAGVLTSGGSESNLMGLMLARDHVLGRASGSRIELDGVPGYGRVPRDGRVPESSRVPERGRVSGQSDVSGHGRRPRIFASAAAHFSVQRAAALLGLGEEAVVPIAVDSELRMIPQELAAALRRATERGELPVAVVATAGTTDTGAIDPLPECAGLAAEYGAWLHVDAAYGGGALLSDRLAPLLAGVERADSISLDWHKLGWQPAAAGVFLVRRAETYAGLARRAAYLNPVDDEEAGYAGLLGRSLRTTRRADAFKIAVTLRTLGRDGLGRLVDACHDLAVAGAAAVRAHPRLELHADPVLTAFLFRYRPADPASSDEVNAGLRRRLLREGRAAIGRTTLPGDGPGRVRLKLTLLNPHTTVEQVERLLEAVADAGGRQETEAGPDQAAVPGP